MVSTRHVAENSRLRGGGIRWGRVVGGQGTLGRGVGGVAVRERVAEPPKQPT